MDDKVLTLILKAKNVGSKEVDKFHASLVGAEKGATGLHKRLITLTKVGLVGLGVGLGAVVGLLGLATNKAVDEEKGVARLNAALEANDKSFSGNTDAIEATIRKREELGFSGDDLRESLTKLVTRTHDSTAALRLQATAMDLARLKSISVADASDILSKGLNGNKKILQQLGIQLPATASQQERLTAIQKVAAGQAEAYGKTAAGAQEAFQVATDQLLADLGQDALPLFKTVFTWLRTDAIPAVRGVIAAVGHWIDQNRPLINQIAGFVGGALKALIGRIGDVVTWIGNTVAAIARNKDAMNVLRTIAQGIGQAFSFAVSSIETIVGWIAIAVAAITSNKAVMRAFQIAWQLIGGALGFVADQLHRVIDLAGSAFDAISRIPGGLGDAVNNLSKIPGGIGDRLTGHAAGGWVGLNGPELGILGENGPEYVIPNHRLGGGGGGASPGGVRIMGVSERELLDMVDRGLYFRLQRSAPTLGRT